MASRITPTPGNVRFFSCKDFASPDPSYIYLIEVDQSPYSPHQFDGKAYCMRLDGANHNAPHHYLEALFKNITYPNLTGSILYQHCTIVNESVVRIMFMIEIKNSTPLQNEEDLYISVAHPSAARHDYGLGKLPGMIRNKENDNFNHHGVRPLLFFGESLEAKLFLDYPTSTRGRTQTISLSFGGKKSPLKRTTLNFQWFVNEYGYANLVEQRYVTNEFVIE